MISTEKKSTQFATGRRIDDEMYAMILSAVNDTMRLAVIQIEELT